MQWRAKFIGRKANAIGITYPIETIVTADDTEQARLELYRMGYEHITRLSLELLGGLCSNLKSKPK